MDKENKTPNIKDFVYDNPEKRNFAYPQTMQVGAVATSYGGLTKTEYFAGQALAGLMANTNFVDRFILASNPDAVSARRHLAKIAANMGGHLAEVLQQAPDGE